MICRVVSNGRRGCLALSYLFFYDFGVLVISDLSYRIKVFKGKKCCFLHIFILKTLLAVVRVGASSYKIYGRR